MREVNPELMRQMEATAREIGNILSQAIKDYHGLVKQGFVLFLFTNDGPEMTYISNSNRSDMVKALKEFIDRNPPEGTWDQHNVKQ